MLRVHAEIHGKKIRCTFPYDRETLNAVKYVNGAKYISPEKGGPAWDFPLELGTGMALRRACGPKLVLGEELRAWAKAKTSAATQLRSLASAISGDLVHVKETKPKLWEALHLGPRGREMNEATREEKLQEPGSYQCPDTQFMAVPGSNPLNANQPGTGKTIETIGAIYEAQLELGPKLVIAPKTSLESVWVAEIQKWAGEQPVLMCEGSRQERMWVLEDAELLIEKGEPFWLIVNPAMMYVKEVKQKNKKGEMVVNDVPLFPLIHDIEWNVVVLDEAHKSGICNPSTVFSTAMGKLKSKKRIALTGTPIAGKPIKLWGIFHWLNPDEFSSKWRFAEQWLIVTKNGFGSDIGGIREEVEDKFYEFIAQYMVRRTKEEVLPDLPRKQYQDLWAEMTPKQAKQYAAMAEESEARIDEEGATISAVGVLAEYTRLKQFANSFCELGKIINTETGQREVLPTVESGKLEVLMEILAERGIVGNAKGEDEEGDQQVVVFSQFSKYVDLIHSFLLSKGIKASKITGDTNKKGQRTAVQTDFQSKDEERSRVLVMTTTAGGVAITLDNADTVVFMDETWIPDDQEQGEDRAHRASRIHQVLVICIRTKGTIEEFILTRVEGKRKINKSILDLRREGYTSLGIEEREARVPDSFTDGTTFTIGLDGNEMTFTKVEEEDE